MAYSVPPRDRSDVTQRSLLKPESLPAAEMRGALQRVIAEHVGVSGDEAVTMGARLLGLKRTGADVRQVLDEQLRQLAYDGKVRVKGGMVYLV